MRRFLSFRWLALPSIALLIASAFAFPAVRATADSYANGFLRDASGNLDVNVARNSAGATTITSTAAITTATTTQLLAASASPTYIWWLGVQSSGANSTTGIMFETSPVAACSSSTTGIGPAQFFTNASQGTTASLFGLASSGLGFGLLATPYLLPANQYLCMVTTGASIAVYGVVVTSV